MYTKNLHIHFVGIGGIGMSGIAKILKQSGYTISGCDPDIHQETIDQLQQLGCIVYHGNNTHQCADESINIVVYIPMYEHTIPSISAEIQHARHRNIPTVTRAQMLAELMRTKYSIAVSGSHGKTTTSALISHILLHASYNPTLVVGGNLKNISSNAHVGDGDFFVAEADESDRSFLQLNPTLAVITNINLEHLETYKDLDDIKNAFIQFINKVPFYGKAIMCIDNNNIAEILPSITANILTYGIDTNAHITGKNIQLHSTSSSFDVYHNNGTVKLGSVTLPLAGIHNVYNALGSITLALEIGIDFTVIAQGLVSFAGVDRRFAFHGTYKGADIFDDYGHHPLEIDLTLTVARKRARHNLTVVFQPHRYTRSEKLWDQFITSFSSHIIDTLIITDIYSAGEYPIDDVTSENMVKALKSAHPSLNVLYVPFSDNFDKIKQTIAQTTQHNDLILFLGAGKMHLIAQQLTNQ